jgi:hypothetical protein
MRHPIVKMILESPQPVRIYALNGMAITYANEIEDTMFWCYLAASGKSWDEAADSFYDPSELSFKSKRNKTDSAVTARVAGTEHHDSWKKLIERIQALLSERNSLRNLIGHNAVSTNVYVPVDQTLENHTTVWVMQEITQKRAMVERLKRPSVKVGDAELSVYCEQLASLYVDLEHFAENVLQFGSTHPLRCG